MAYVNALLVIKQPTNPLSKCFPSRYSLENH